MTSDEIVFAANNGDIGGGEVMLLQMAEVARRDGRPVHVVGPSARRGVVDEAASRGFSTTGLAGDRRHYMLDLRRWATDRTGLLWCNGLVPALATATRRDRVVHLHQLPQGLHIPAARLARHGARATVVPSHFMARRNPGSRVVGNWSPTRAPRPGSDPRVGRITTLGFIGRLSAEKGLADLCAAVRTLLSDGFDVRLVVAGEARFVGAASRAEVERSLSHLGPRAERVGWVDPQDFLDEVDAVVIPSRAPESFGLTLIDAMAANRPVVITDAGALPEIVGPRHPWVATAGDSASLAEVLRGLLLEDDEARRAAVDAAHLRWQQRYSAEVGEAAFAAFLQELLSQQGAAP